ncbi:MAG: fibronectin type III domain-containing protein [Ignavibacteriae bacterium]|nr:fibronectin type III domain-containing protein [Ignavibacteriota bacterium]
MKRNIFSILILVVLGSISMLLLSGCDKEETLTPQDFAPPTNFKAIAKSGSVTLTWTASVDDGIATFAGYRVQVYNASNVKIDSVQITATTFTKTGLTNGDNYTFKIRSVKSNGDVSVELSLLWGPTQRFSAATIYEFDSSNPSGLQFSSGNTFPFSSSSPDNRANIDLWIDGRSNGTPLLKSPSDEDFASSGWRTTKLYETIATSLDDAVDFPDESAFRTSPGLTIVANKVYLAITQDGHYARFQASAVQGTAPNRSVNITIAWNSGSGPWAKK